MAPSHPPKLPPASHLQVCVHYPLIWNYLSFLLFSVNPDLTSVEASSEPLLQEASMGPAACAGLSPPCPFSTQCTWPVLDSVSPRDPSQPNDKIHSFHFSYVPHCAYHSSCVQSRGSTEICWVINKMKEFPTRVLLSSGVPMKEAEGLHPSWSSCQRPGGPCECAEVIRGILNHTAAPEKTQCKGL